MGYQDLDVLDAADEPVLYALPVQTPPTRSFEVMQVSPLGKTAFHQMTSANTVLLGFRAAGLFLGFSDEFLSQVPHDGASILGGRASRPQMATRACLFVGFVFGRFAPFVITSRIKVFSSRADVDILFGIIPKVGFGKNLQVLALVACVQGHVAANPATLQLAHHFGCPILAVGNDRPRTLTTVCFMLLNEGFNLGGFIEVSRRARTRRNHSNFIVYRAVVLVTRTRFSSTRMLLARYAGSVRIGRAEHRAVDPLIIGVAQVAVQLRLHRPVSLAQLIDQLR